jgi:hypothetical protein
MEEFLKQMKGKKIDISCGANSNVRGDVMDVKNDILYLRDENERVAYVAIGKIAVVWEVNEHQSRPGFVV